MSVTRCVNKTVPVMYCGVFRLIRYEMCPEESFEMLERTVDEVNKGDPTGMSQNTGINPCS